MIQPLQLDARLRPGPLGTWCCALLLVACGGGAQDNTRNTADAAALVSLALAPLAEGRAQALATATTATATAAALLVTTERDAVRLADQASFGASEALVASIRSQGAAAWVAAQVQTSGSRYTAGQGSGIHVNDDGSFCDNKGDNCWRDYFSTEPLAWDFYRNAVTQPDQLRQRVAFALSQMLVVSNVEVSGTYGFRHYHNNLLDGAFGNYREVLRKVMLSPVMGDYLDHVNNDRDNPNENFAREFLQLFTIGTCKLLADGSLEGGRCLPSYDNELVRNYAFALTGWTYPSGGSSPWGCWPEGANCTFYGSDMVARPALADRLSRTLLSGITVPAARSPAQALELVLDSVMAQPSMAPFISKQLIQHLVKSNPTPAYVQRVAAAFRSGRYTSTGTTVDNPSRNFGRGVPGDLAATVAAALLDNEARNSAPPLVAEKLREPVLMMTGVLRALNGRSDGAALTWWWGDHLRQHVFRSPSVFNFYPPNYPVTGTRLVGSAFGIYNVNTAFSRLNFLNQMLFWGGADADVDVPQAIGTQVNLAAFEADAGNPSVLIDRLARLATGGRLSTTSRATILRAVNAWDASQSNDWRMERVRTAAYLVFAAPAYQVMN